LPARCTAVYEKRIGLSLATKDELICRRSQRPVGLTVGRIAPHAWPIATKTANITDVRRLRALSRYRLRHIGAEACELSVFAVAISARFSLFAAGTRVAHEHTALLIWDADPVITEHTAEAHHYDSETVVLTRRVHGWKFVWSWFPD
jgi:hypothetical protein